MEHSLSNPPLRLAADGNHPLTVLRPSDSVIAFVMNEIAAALEYADPRHLRQLVDRADEFIPGVDFLVVEGEQLAQLKAAAPDVVDPRAPSLMLLTESGVHLACILTRQPAGVRLRRWLADVALPALRQGAPLAPAPGAPSAERPLPRKIDPTITATRAVIESEATGNERAVLLALVNTGATTEPRAVSNAGTFDLASVAGLSRSNVVLAIRRLREVGVVRVAYSGHDRAAERWIVWPALVEYDGKGGHTSYAGADRLRAAIADFVAELPDPDVDELRQLLELDDVDRSLVFSLAAAAEDVKAATGALLGDIAPGSIVVEAERITWARGGAR